MIRALFKAGIAFIDPARLEEIAHIPGAARLSRCPPDLIGRAISTDYASAGAEPMHIPDFMFQHRQAANFPWVSQAGVGFTRR